MKTLIFLLTLMVVCQVSVADGTELENVLLQTTQNWGCTTQGLQCQNCSTMQLCSSDVEPLYSIKCADQNALLPYCDPNANACTNKMPEICGPPTPDFYCPGFGYYPDLLNCNKYYYCYDAGNNKPIEDNCPRGTIYNHTDQFCSAFGVCSSYSSTNGLCKKHVNKLIPYSPSPRLYVLCSADKAPLLFQCPGEDEEFDASTVSCTFQCKANGRFPYSPGSNKFYLCVKLINSYSKTVGECPIGSIFKYEEINYGKGYCQPI